MRIKKPSRFETPLARLLTMRAFIEPLRGPKHTGEARKRDRAPEPSRGPKKLRRRIHMHLMDRINAVDNVLRQFHLR